VNTRSLVRGCRERTFQTKLAVNMCTRSTCARRECFMAASSPAGQVHTEPEPRCGHRREFDSNIPGVRVIRKRDFVGVVAPGEMGCHSCRPTMKVTWGTVPSLPGNAGLYEKKMRTEKRPTPWRWREATFASALAGPRMSFLNLVVAPTNRMHPLAQLRACRRPAGLRAGRVLDAEHLSHPR